nr:Gfo/Idh/MocA family oxidoreductase [Jiangella mangrovi]
MGAGDIGRPAVIAERRTAHYAPDARPGWFFDPELAGGGILMNVGAHSIDKIHWLGGAPAERVVARVSSKPGVAVETEAVGLLELANGLAAAISVTGTGLPFHDQTEIVGDDGALRLSRDTGLSVFRAGSGSGDGTLVVRPEDDDIEAAFRDQLADFVDACRSQRPPAVDGAYGRSVVATATAMYQSAARTELVRIAPLASEAA